MGLADLPVNPLITRRGIVSRGRRDAPSDSSQGTSFQKVPPTLSVAFHRR
jgi:hypothetical protein